MYKEIITEQEIEDALDYLDRLEKFDQEYDHDVVKKLSCISIHFFKLWKDYQKLKSLLDKQIY